MHFTLAQHSTFFTFTLAFRLVLWLLGPSRLVPWLGWLGLIVIPVWLQGQK